MQVKKLIIITAVIIGLTGATAFALESPQLTKQVEPMPVEVFTEPEQTPVTEQPTVTPESVETPAEPVSAPEPTSEPSAPVAPVVERQYVPLMMAMPTAESQTTTETVDEPLLSPLTP